jgi:hypothetical protein
MKYYSTELAVFSFLSLETYRSIGDSQCRLVMNYLVT